MDKTIGAGEFKAKCLHLLDEVAERRTPLVITKRGKPVAKLVPLDDKPVDIYGRMKGTAKIIGDIVSPLDDVMWTYDEENILGGRRWQAAAPDRHACLDMADARYRRAFGRHAGDGEQGYREQPGAIVGDFVLGNRDVGVAQSRSASQARRSMAERVVVRSCSYCRSAEP